MDYINGIKIIEVKMTIFSMFALNFKPNWIKNLIKFWEYLDTNKKNPNICSPKDEENYIFIPDTIAKEI